MADAAPATLPSLLAAASAAGLAAGLLCRPGPVRVRARRIVPAGPADRSRAPRPPTSAVIGLAAVLGCAAVVVTLGPPSLLLAASGAVVVGGGGWLHERARRRRAAELGRRQTLEACDALVAELRAGQPPVRALERAAEHHPALSRVARAGMLGGDVGAVLRQVAAMPGHAGLSAVAAGWRVAETSGASLATVLQRVTQAVREDDAVAAEVGAALAPARATARLLAVLPAFGLLLGSGLGGDPVGLLLRSPPGNALLLAGVLLALAGTVWVERLADRVQE